MFEMLTLYRQYDQKDPESRTECIRAIAKKLAEIEEWERYKHQKHDLFVSRNETADHFIEQSSKILALEN